MKKTKKIRIILFATWGLSMPTLIIGQTLSLDSCQYYAIQNFPIQKSFALIADIKTLDLSNLNKSLKPTVHLGGQATYQSEVTRLPINLPGTTVNPISRDQYKIFTDISQSMIPLFHKREKEELIAEETLYSQKKTALTIYKLRESVIHTYFGLLLLEGQINQIKPVLKDIQTGIEKLKIAESAGTSSIAQILILEAEKLKIEQKQASLIHQHDGLTQVLSHLIHRPLTNEQKFTFPDERPILEELKREELSLFASQKLLIQHQAVIAKERLRPVLQIFGQAGYGRPGLNMLNNAFDFYYLGGIRLQLNLSNRYTYKNDLEKLSIQSQLIEIEKEQFELNIKLALDKQRAEIKKYQALMNQSYDIIKLREKIKELAKSQLENGIISALDYLSYVEAEDQAIQDQLFYKIQLAMAAEYYQYILGN
ncbi:MAG: TolC family protein [Saprospiraceae bacterium]|nr:TolC family protein [Saprospiraceae bacterium]